MEVCREVFELADEEIASLVRLLFVGGFETTFRAMGSLFVGLLTTGQWGLLLQRPTLIRAAVEEALRWEAPILGQVRYSVRQGSGYLHSGRWSGSTSCEWLLTMEPGR